VTFSCDRGNLAASGRVMPRARSWSLSLVMAVGCGGARPAPASPIGNESEAIGATGPTGWARCPEILATAEAEFRRDAPTIYPDYRTLDWSPAAPVDEPRDESLVRVEVTPGRSWRFQAWATPDDGMLPAAALATTSPTWTPAPEFELARVRRAGRLALAISIETERSAVPLAEHPLATQFIDRMQRALDRCAVE